MIRKIKERIQESISVKQLFLQDEKQLALLAEIASVGANALKAGNKILLAGNGGSYADSIHIAGELTARFILERQTLPALALGSNNSTLTAIGNDYSFDDVFSRELQGLGNEGDLFIAISTSGNSSNIINAVGVSLNKKIHTYCFTGSKGGKLSSMCPCLKVPSDNTARIQEVHILAGHILCELIEQELFNKI